MKKDSNTGREEHSFSDFIEKVRDLLNDSPLIEDAGLGASRMMLQPGSGVFLNAFGAFYQACDQGNRAVLRVAFAEPFWRMVVVAILNTRDPYYGPMPRSVMQQETIREIIKTWPESWG